MSPMPSPDADILKPPGIMPRLTFIGVSGWMSPMPSRDDDILKPPGIMPRLTFIGVSGWMSPMPSRDDDILKLPGIMPRLSGGIQWFITKTRTFRISFQKCLLVERRYSHPGVTPPDIRSGEKDIARCERCDEYRFSNHLTERRAKRRR
jgi:hypothetical protein